MNVWASHPCKRCGCSKGIQFADDPSTLVSSWHRLSLTCKGCLGRLTAGPQPWDSQLPLGGASEYLLTVAEVSLLHSNLWLNFCKAIAPLPSRIFGLTALCSIEQSLPQRIVAKWSHGALKPTASPHVAFRISRNPNIATRIRIDIATHK